MTKHVNITIKGRVQGVGFRYHARSMAFKLGIRGIIKNLPDGKVYIEAEGDEESVQKFIEWCWEGPPHAHVEHVSVIPGQIKDYVSFEVVH